MNKRLVRVILTSVVTTLVTVFALGKWFQSNTNTPFIKPSMPVHATGFFPEGSLPANPTVDFEAAASKAVPAVVHIRTTTKTTAVNNPFGNRFNDPFFDQFFGDAYRDRTPQPRMGSGSGVVISADGYVITNNHVVAGADEVTVTFNDRLTKTAKVVGTDPATDIALLKIEAKNLPFIEFANSDQVKLGQWVLAVGYPLSLDATVTAGIVSAKSRALGINQRQSPNAIESFIQTDAAVNQGNSGGALVNTDGQLIGINSAIASPTGSYAGYSYAIPSNIVKKVATDLKQFGSVQRGFLGIEIRDIKNFQSEEIVKLGLDRHAGVYVHGFMEPSSAKDAGLKVGDIVTKVNGIAVRTVPELMAQVAIYKPGDKIGLTYVRNDKMYNTTVELKNISGTTAIVKNSAAENVLGANLRLLSNAEKAKYNLKSGLLVVSVGNGILSKQTNIKNGFIITEVNEQTVQSLSDLNRALQSDGMVYISGIYPGNNAHYYYGIRPEIKDKEN